MCASYVFYISLNYLIMFFFFSSRRRHTRCSRDWSSDVCSSDLRPRDIVSGDFYWFATSNGKRLVAAVDCTGHGVPGAFMSMIGNAFLQEIVNGKGITNPADILSELRFLVINALKQKGQAGEQHDGMDISLCCFDENNNLEWAGANNPLWILRNNECIEVEPDKRPIGFFRGQ